MNRIENSDKTATIHVPRERGDEPAAIEKETRFMGCSPRARG